VLKNFLRSTTLCSAILSTTLLTAASQPKPFNRPLVFEPNQGQVSSQVSWTAQGAGYRFYMTPAGGSIVLAEPVRLRLLSPKLRNRFGLGSRGDKRRAQNRRAQSS
jgi:hypothetical protein